MSQVTLTKTCPIMILNGLVNIGTRTITGVFNSSGLISFSNDLGDTFSITIPHVSAMSSTATSVTYTMVSATAITLNATAVFDFAVNPNHVKLTITGTASQATQIALAFSNLANAVTPNATSFLIGSQTLITDPLGKTIGTHGINFDFTDISTASAYASPNLNVNVGTTFTLDPSISSSASNYPMTLPARNIVYVGGYWYIFFVDSSNNLGYVSTTNWTSFSAETTVAAMPTNSANTSLPVFCVYTDGTTIVVVYGAGTWSTSSSTTTTVYSQASSSLSGGVISWATAVQIFQCGGYNAFTLVKTSGGTWWMVALWIGSAATYYMNAYYSTNLTSWTSSFTSYSGMTTSNTSVFPMLVTWGAKSNAALVLFGAVDGASYIRYRSYATSWATVANTKNPWGGGDYNNQNTMSAVDDGTLVHLVSISAGSAGGTISYSNFNSSGTWATVSSVDTSTCFAPSLSYNSTLGMFMFYWIGSTIYYRTYSSGWSATTTFATQANLTALVSEQYPSTNGIGVTYASGTSSPYALTGALYAALTPVAAAGSIGLSNAGTTAVNSLTAVSASGTIGLADEGTTAEDNLTPVAGTGEIGLANAGTAIVSGGSTAVSASGTIGLSNSGVGVSTSLASVAAPGSVGLSNSGVGASTGLGLVSAAGSVGIASEGSGASTALGTVSASGAIHVANAGTGASTALTSVAAPGTIGLSNSGVGASSALSPVSASGSLNLSNSGTGTQNSLNPISAAGSISLAGEGSSASTALTPVSGSGSVGISNLASPSPTALTPVSASGSIGLTCSATLVICSPVFAAGFVGLSNSGAAITANLSPINASGEISLASAGAPFTNSLSPVAAGAHISLSVGGASSVDSLTSVSANGSLSIMASNQCVVVVPAIPVKVTLVDPTGRQNLEIDAGTSGSQSTFTLKAPARKPKSAKKKGKLRATGGTTVKVTFVDYTGKEDMATDAP